ncbi:tRNA epoxyqueuosine(34) reductase QueG [Paenibacillus sp. GCM10023248]|uniref:tRNA epoxyqueuosine(34) reductase QueG n=1 Tax=unclassified Paenibacillus TaxID=185978 RepID=UPI002379FBD0|nr:tRNA epoxyqueuosine(34) reductase QueG [Paenibacillus sp. MAHUQ-63]MDD9271100.1 tRNA epoxyqueuosine(34) reductase QueG [Paenibacillus sp. MAHUQ-63]
MALSMETATKADISRLQQEIVEAAPSLGIDKIGFTSAEPFTELKDILLRHREKGFESGFEEPDIEKRVRPELSMDAPRSIISIAVAYPSKLANPPRSEPGAYRGIISRASWGRDYHDVLRDRLAKLEAFIAERMPDARLQSMVDTGALVDRAVAERAGIGWSGKNCAVITPEWGSWVYLGEMITDIPFAADTPMMDQCGDCTICIDACPTGAIVGPGQLNSSRCISFITQTKGYVEDEFKLKIGNRLYGCDTCQIVCPKNKGMNWTHHPEFEPDPEKVKPLLIPLLTMSNKDFKEQYGRIAASWRGKKPIQRNAIIALGNFKDRTAVPVLNELLQADPRPEIRATAAWALGRIGGEDAAAALEKAQQDEREPAVREDIEKAIAAVAASSREMEST